MKLRDRLGALTRAMTRRVAPSVRYHQDTFVDALSAYVPRGGRWLDLGCGHQLLPSWASAAAADYVGRAGLVVGLDYDLEALSRHRTIRARCRGNIGELPFAGGVFDLITANMVVEHLDRPAEQFAEVARILAPGGVFIFHTPNAANYQVRVAQLIPDAIKSRLAGWVEGRRADDVYPTHYRANSGDDVRRLAAGAGFVVERIDFISSYPGLGIFPPLALLELLWIRQLERPELAEVRHNIIGFLRKSPAS